MYKLKLNRREKKELALSKWLLVLLAALGLAAVIWLAWIRPAQRAGQVNSFAACQAAGNRIQESYPEVCLTLGGKRFVNPAQAQAHQTRADQPAIPANPQLLIDEWQVRVPLTSKTFDLIYTYIKDGADERVTFSFKRLVAAGFCQGDIGLSLARSITKHQSPFSPANPEPIAQAGNYYFYPAYATSPCYDPSNPNQTSLVTQIAGNQTLTQATATLLGKLESASQ